MLFVPILNAIVTMLSTDVSTKDLIKAYRLFTVPAPGTRLTPLCVLAPDLSTEEGISGYSPTILRNRKVSFGVHLFERAYTDPQSTYKAAVTTLDTLQHNTCLVLEADPTLSNTVTNSHIAAIRLQRYDEEYFEFKITLMVDTKLE